MLVITRKTGEGARIELPDGRIVRVAIHGIDRGKVQLRFEADQDITILRDELAERPRKDGDRASASES